MLGIHSINFHSLNDSKSILMTINYYESVNELNNCGFLVSVHDSRYLSSDCEMKLIELVNEILKKEELKNNMEQ